MNALGYANREDFVMEIIKTLFDGVVFCAALAVTSRVRAPARSQVATIFAWVIVIEALMR